MRQLLSLNEILSFGKIQSLLNIPIIAINHEKEIKYINSIAKNWLDPKTNASTPESQKIDLEQLFINDGNHKWEKKTVDVENDEWSLFIGNKITNESDINNTIHLNNIIENFPELIYWKDSQFIYQGCNKNTATMLGYKTPSDIIGKSDINLAEEFGWPEERVKHLQDIDRAIIEQGITNIEDDSISGYDNTRIFVTSKKPLYDNGKIVGILGISTDITDRKKMEEELRAEKEKNEVYLHGIVENLPQLVYWKDKNFIYQGCNNFCADVLNLQTPAQIIGKSDNDFGWSKKRIEELHHVDREIIKNGIPQVVEDIIPIKNSNRTFLTSKTPLIDKNGNIVGVLGISTDITDRKNMEADLKRAKEAAEAGERAKATFIANMSHDLRTPLTGVIGEAYMLKGNVTDAQRIQYADELAKSGETLLKMYNEIIEDVRSDRMTEEDLEAETFDLNTLLTQLKDAVQPTFTWKGLTLNISVDSNVPNFLVSDHRKIYRIIENLVGNAMKFTDQGHIDLKIELIETQKYTVKIKINIIDTGIGIPQNGQSKLFERFYKVTPSYKGKYQGFGLGLNIAKNYTTVLNGTIGFESTEGIGSNFYVILTIKIATDEEIDAYKKKRSEPKPSLLRGNQSCLSESKSTATPCEETSRSTIEIPNDAPHVLVIEDNLVARTLTVIFVKQAKLNVTEAPDGQTALELAKNQQFDLILADVGLPDISGIEVTRKLRQFEKEQGKQPATIIGITAHAADGRNECIDAGMNEALPKPFTIDMMNEIIKVYLPEFKSQNI